jgi:hypothetical protein
VAAARQETVLQGLPPDLSRQLTDLARQAGANQKRAKIMGGSATAATVATVVSFFFSWQLGVALLIAAIVLWVMFASAPMRGLDLERVALARDVVDVLAADASTKSPMVVTVRHGDMFRFGEVKDRDKTGSVETIRAEDTWLSLRTRMQDRSALRLEVGQSGKQKSKQKRKYTRSQAQMVDEIAVTLRVPSDRYPDLSRLTAFLEPQKLRQGTSLTVGRVQVAEQTVRFSAVSGTHTRSTGRGGATSTGNAAHRITPEKILGALAYLYGGLSQCAALPAAPARKAMDGPRQPGSA